MTSSGSRPDHSVSQLTETIQRLEQRVEQLKAALTSALDEVGKAALEMEEKDKMLVRAADMEKQRLAEDLHDNLGQLLTGIGFVSRGLEESLTSQGLPEAESATSIKEMALQALDQVRSIARGRSSHHVERVGLAPSLKHLCQTVSRLHGIRCTFSVDNVTIPVGPGASTSLFHIAQEAITNAIRHGRADQIQVMLANTHGDIELTISANGKWIEPSEKSDGLGMAIMHSRARSIGGFLKILFDECGEVEVRCTVPLRKIA